VTNILLPPAFAPQESEQVGAEINELPYFYGLNWIINIPVKMYLFHQSRTQVKSQYSIIHIFSQLRPEWQVFIEKSIG